jgi:hypothetical protein
MPDKQINQLNFEYSKRFAELEATATNSIAFPRNSKYQESSERDKTADMNQRFKIRQEENNTNELNPKIKT